MCSEARFAPRGLKADVVVLDPPRDGCGEGVIDAVAAIQSEADRLCLMQSRDAGAGHPTAVK